MLENIHQNKTIYKKKTYLYFFKCSNIPVMRGVSLYRYVSDLTKASNEIVTNPSGNYTISTHKTHILHFPFSLVDTTPHKYL